jgi:hypothetical protein
MIFNRQCGEFVLVDDGKEREGIWLYGWAQKIRLTVIAPKAAPQLREET